MENDKFVEECNKAFFNINSKYAGKISILNLRNNYLRENGLKYNYSLNNNNIKQTHKDEEELER